MEERATVEATPSIHPLHPLHSGLTHSGRGEDREAGEGGREEGSERKAEGEERREAWDRGNDKERERGREKGLSQ